MHYFQVSHFSFHQYYGCIKSLKNLHTLKLNRYFRQNILDDLTSLSHLKKLVLHYDSLSTRDQTFLSSKYEVYLQLLDSLPNLSQLYLQSSEFRSNFQLQRKYPHVRFRWWCDDEEHMIRYLKYGGKRGYYEGEFLDDSLSQAPFSNLRHGKGVLNLGTFQYKGEFKRGISDGLGVINWDVSDCNPQDEFDESCRWRKYEGEVKENNPHGKGVLHYFHPSVRYEGYFVCGKYHGKGVKYYQRSRIEGNFENDLIRNCTIYADGCRFEGIFNHSKAEGILYSDHGTKFAGELRYSTHYGDLWRIRGIQYYPNKNRFEGTFKGDKPSSGILYYSNGDRYEGKFYHFQTVSFSHPLSPLL